MNGRMNEWMIGRLSKDLLLDFDFPGNLLLARNGHVLQKRMWNL
jgi:hypothetical protein